MAKSNYPLRELLLKNYDTKLDTDGINGDRLATRLEKVAQIGLTSDNGANRPGFSPLELEAKKVVIEWMKNAGLSVSIDGAGNVFGRLEGKNPDKKAVISGSHVDSVPNGGHFDGPLGVLAALEVVEAWRETGYIPERPYEVVIFTDEEGARFNSGLLGSKAAIGSEDIENITQLTDVSGRPFSAVLEDVGLSVEGYRNAKRDWTKYELYIEVHIEQGKRLEKRNLPCGIVSGIAGPYWLECTFYGEAGHAGNTPMEDRKDALVSASNFIQEVAKIPATISDSAVATVGKVEVKPNGVNIIPGEVRLMVDARDITKVTQQKLVAEIKECAKKIAKAHGLDVNLAEKVNISPLEISKKHQEQLHEVLEELGVEPYYLPSGAGHDAMIIGEKIPAAMIFVKSKDGISHRPDEWSDLNDCIKAVHILKRFIEKRQL